MKMLAALDRFVHAARLDLLTPHGRRRSRNLRWLPVPVLAALPVSYGLMVWALGQTTSADWRDVMWLIFAAGAVFWLAFGAANLMRLFGPRISWEAGELDEREQAVKARAGSLSYLFVAALAVAGCFYMASATVFGTWVPSTSMEWVYLGLLLQAYATLLPVLVASWLQPNADEMD